VIGLARRHSISAVLPMLPDDPIGGGDAISENPDIASADAAVKAAHFDVATSGLHGCRRSPHLLPATIIVISMVKVTCQSAW